MKISHLNLFYLSISACTEYRVKIKVLPTLSTRITKKFGNPTDIFWNTLLLFNTCIEMQMFGIYFIVFDDKTKDTLT